MTPDEAAAVLEPRYLYAIPIRMQQIAELERERGTPRQLLL